MSGGKIKGPTTTKPPNTLAQAGVSSTMTKAAAVSQWGATSSTSAAVQQRSMADERRGRARYRFALAGVALALVAGIGTPMLAKMVARSWTLPVEPALIGVGFFVAMFFLAAGWLIGRRVDKLTDEARRDPVTRVGNRRHWDECLAHEVASARDARMPLSLLMVDVDNLKKLNDRGGHGVGDQALAIVGDVLNDTCRSRDVAARFGGDEFALLLPRTRASEARVVAERLRAALSSRREACGESPLKDLLTVSIGIADIDSIDGPPSSFALFDAADRALYAAKESGRDRVVVYERATPSMTVAVVPPAPRSSSVVIDLEERRRAKKRESRSGSLV